MRGVKSFEMRIGDQQAGEGRMRSVSDRRQCGWSEKASCPDCDGGITDGMIAGGMRAVTFCACALIAAPIADDKPVKRRQKIKEIKLI